MSTGISGGPRSALTKKTRGILEESQTFLITCELIPRTAVVQSMVSYKRFTDYVLLNYGPDYFFDKKEILVSLVLKNSIKDIRFGELTFSCSNIKSAIMIAKKYLARSRHGYLEFRITVNGNHVPVPVVRYSVSAEVVNGSENCEVVKLFEKKDRI